MVGAGRRRTPSTAAGPAGGPGDRCPGLRQRSCPPRSPGCSQLLPGPRRGGESGQACGRFGKAQSALKHLGRGKTSGRAVTTSGASLSPGIPWWGASPAAPRTRAPELGHCSQSGKETVPCWAQGSRQRSSGSLTGAGPVRPQADWVMLASQVLPFFR